jgi:hypothetical protein
MARKQYEILIDVWHEIKWLPEVWTGNPKLWGKRRIKRLLWFKWLWFTIEIWRNF